MLTRSALRRLVLSGVVAASVLGLFLAGTEACTTTACNGSSLLYTAGDLPDGANTWESTPIDGNWIHYAPSVTVHVEIPELANRTVINTQVFLSPVFDPNAVPPAGGAPNNYAEASGNLAEIEQVLTQFGDPSGPNAGKQVLSLEVLNGTCAEYYARILVIVAPEAADAGTEDDAADAGDALPD
jgi:hypothetical protein